MYQTFSRNERNALRRAMREIVKASGKTLSALSEESDINLNSLKQIVYGKSDHTRNSNNIQKISNYVIELYRQGNLDTFLDRLSEIDLSSIRTIIENSRHVTDNALATDRFTFGDTRRLTLIPSSIQSMLSDKICIYRLAPDQSRIIKILVRQDRESGDSGKYIMFIRGSHSGRIVHGKFANYTFVTSFVGEGVYVENWKDPIEEWKSHNQAGEIVGLDTFTFRSAEIFDTYILGGFSSLSGKYEPIFGTMIITNESSINNRDLDSYGSVPLLECEDSIGDQLVRDIFKTCAITTYTAASRVQLRDNVQR